MTLFLEVHRVTGRLRSQVDGERFPTICGSNRWPSNFSGLAAAMTQRHRPEPRTDARVRWWHTQTTGNGARGSPIENDGTFAGLIFNPLGALYLEASGAATAQILVANYDNAARDTFHANSFHHLTYPVNFTTGILSNITSSALRRLSMYWLADAKNYVTLETVVEFLRGLLKQPTSRPPA